MTCKSGFTNENSAVRWERAPGPLANAAGFTYQEFSTLEDPSSLKGNPFHVSPDENKVRTWAEFIQLTSAECKTLAVPAVLPTLKPAQQSPHEFCKWLKAQSHAEEVIVLAPAGPVVAMNTHAWRGGTAVPARAE